MAAGATVPRLIATGGRVRQITSMSGSAGPGRIVRLLRAFTVVMAVILVGVAAYLAVGVVRDRAETVRTAPRFDPPVWAGQLVPVPCANGGFYARDHQAIVLTIAAHCYIAKAGTVWLDSESRLIGTWGRLAELTDCPAGRFCAPADI